ncbi:MAG: O-antigen ligase family protein [Patescibacteria group bacterium]
MIKRLEQFLFYFLFFAIPFQTRKILYYPGWYFNEWQSVSVYATDLLLIVLFFFWGFSAIRGSKFLILNFKFLNKFQIPNSRFQIHDYFLVLFLIVAGISVKNSSDFYVGAFLWLKLVEFALFYFYLKTYAVKKFGFIKILYALILGGAFQAIIAIGQFLKQGDLGLRWLGESVLGVGLSGIASFFNTAGEKVIRVYGTTPHPNVLSAYLLLSIFAIYFLWFYPKRNSAFPNSIFYFLFSIFYAVILFGLFFTFSRTTIFLWAVGFALIGFFNFFKPQFRRLLLLTFLICLVFVSIYWPEVSSRLNISSQEEAVQLRTFYNQESLKSGLNLFGIGLGDFTGWLMEQNPNLPRYVYQPVHNIYLLLYSETGILGLLTFLLFLFFLIKNSFSKKVIGYWLLVIGVLFLGLFDHFLLTIQQGRFILWSVLTVLAIGDIIKEQSGNRAT